VISRLVATYSGDLPYDGDLPWERLGLIAPAESGADRIYRCKGASTNSSTPSAKLWAPPLHTPAHERRRLPMERLRRCAARRRPPVLACGQHKLHMPSGHICKWRPTRSCWGRQLYVGQSEQRVSVLDCAPRLVAHNSEPEALRCLRHVATARFDPQVPRVCDDGQQLRGRALRDSMRKRVTWEDRRAYSSLARCQPGAGAGILTTSRNAH